MSAILFNDANPNLNLSKIDDNQPLTAFKIRETPQKEKNNDDIEVIASKEPQPKIKTSLEKLKKQAIEDIKANSSDSKDIKRSFSRGFSHRIWTQGLSVLGGYLAGDKLASNLLHGGFPFEIAYQTINRSADKLGGSIVPELAKSYEAENGKNKDNIGSIGHIAVKTIDHVARGLIEPMTAATISRGVSSAIHTVRGTGNNPSLTGQWKNELLKDGDFGNGELVDELSYYGGLDLGIHISNALGLKKTWSGAALASTIAAAAYSTRDPAGSVFDATNTGTLSKKFIARAIQRLGVMGHIYALPLPFMDSAFPASKDTAAKKFDEPKKSEAELTKDKKVNLASRASEALYALITFGGLSALYAYQNKKS